MAAVLWGNFLNLSSNLSFDSLIFIYCIFNFEAFFLFFVFLSFLGPHLRRMEVPGLGVESEL